MIFFPSKIHQKLARPVDDEGKDRCVNERMKERGRERDREIEARERERERETER